MTNPKWKYFSVLNSFDGDVGIAIGALTGGTTPASSTFPASNDALFVPMCIQQGVLVKRLFSINGGTASGNIDMGIYSKDGARIVSIGSTAQSGTNAPQFFDITDTFLGAGLYYLAVAMDNTTGTLFRANQSVTKQQAIGMAKATSAFALPASVTFAAVTGTFIPLIGAEVERVL